MEKQTIEGKRWQLHCSEKLLQVIPLWSLESQLSSPSYFQLKQDFTSLLSIRTFIKLSESQDTNNGLNTTVTFFSAAWMMMKTYISLNLLWRWLADFCWSFIQKLNFSERFGSFNKECHSLVLGFAPTKNRTMHIHRAAVLWSALLWHSYSGQSLFSYI